MHAAASEAIERARRVESELTRRLARPSCGRASGPSEAEGRPTWPRDAPRRSGPPRGGEALGRGTRRAGRGGERASWRRRSSGCAARWRAGPRGRRAADGESEERMRRLADRVAHEAEARARAEAEAALSQEATSCSARPTSGSRRHAAARTIRRRSTASGEALAEQAGGRGFEAAAERATPGPAAGCGTVLRRPQATSCELERAFLDRALQVEERGAEAAVQRDRRDPLGDQAGDPAAGDAVGEAEGDPGPAVAEHRAAASARAGRRR